MAHNPVAELTHHLHSRHLHPTPQWLQNFTAGVRSTTPLPALKQTALFRLLATDVTTTLSQPPSAVFPRDVANGKVQTRPLIGPVVCQVLDIEDIGHSKWSQVEAIEAREKGESTKGREVIRIVPGDDSNSVDATPEGAGPHKLLLQDAEGLKVFALELSRIEGLNTSMSIGVKLLIRNCEARRGVIILEPGCVQILGGKIETLDKLWKTDRKERLAAAAKAEREED